MKTLKTLIPVEEALGKILDAVRAVEGVETLPLADASGSVLASPLVSEILVPPFARAAMDGYAVKASDTVGASRYEPRGLRLGEVLHAGRLPEGEVTSGSCAQIATGAPLPAGADAVVKVEDTLLEGGEVRLTRPVYAGENVSAPGEDIRPGDEVLRAGDVLTPARIGVAAALGRQEIGVFPRPRALLYTTGDEIHPPGSPLPPGKIYDINSYTLAALLERAGLTCERGDNVEDRPDAIREALRRGSAYDLVLFSGGSSAGDRDLIAGILETEGEVVFHGIAIKPGKPTLFGLYEDVPVFGMPGFPTSCLTVAMMLVVPAALRMARRPSPMRKTVRARLGAKITTSLGRLKIFTVRLEGDRALPVYKESGDITSLSEADGYIEIPATLEVLDRDEEIDVVLL